MIDQDKWSVRIYHKPLIRFIWIGALMMALGAILSVLMKRRNIKATRIFAFRHDKIFEIH